MVFLEGRTEMAKPEGEERKQALAEIPNWREVPNRDAITRKFAFDETERVDGTHDKPEKNDCHE